MRRPPIPPVVRQVLERDPTASG
ncbi:MAG: hypothetical protein QOC64_2969, partial [Solirubrobacteraceae bacterium]|nr:hypothetical protein [Solirubrobacteraceae bacterium]